MGTKESDFKFRKAVSGDLEALSDLEKLCFTSDLLSRRSFKNLIDSRSARLYIASKEKTIAAYFLLLFKKGSSLARLYSLAVHPDFRKEGLARRLMSYMATVAEKRGAAYIRLEVSEINYKAVNLYEAEGYTLNNRKEGYYEDGTTALIYQKRVAIPSKTSLLKIDFYPQSIDFTCGPACLMMAFSSLKSGYSPSLDDELQIWREANTVFMATGHPGCTAPGLALSALNRGFQVKLITNSKKPPLIEGLRNKLQKEIAERVHTNFLKKLKELAVENLHSSISFTGIHNYFKEGWVPIVLISLYRLQQSKSPHWVIVTGCDKNFIYIHDPYIEKTKGMADLENMNIPISRVEFMKMSRYGSKQLRSCLLIKYK